MKPLSFNVGQYGPTNVFLRDLDEVAAIEPRAQVRLDAVWRYLSDSTGTKYNFTSLDAKVKAITDRGLRVRLMIPMWCPDKVLAGKPDKTQIKTSAALTSYTSFVRALGLRLASNPSVRGAASGNEPNLKNPFAPDGADPKWQAMVTNAILPVLPAAWKLYTPGMAPASDGGGYMSPLTYLKGYWPALNEASRQRLHGVEIHPYGRAADVAQSWSVLGKLRAIHDLTGKPIDASEYNSDWHDTDQAKAVNVPKGLDYMASLGFVERVFMYAMSDAVTDKDYHLGMIDGAGNHRPLFGTTRDWAAAH